MRVALSIAAFTGWIGCDPKKILQLCGPVSRYQTAELEDGEPIADYVARYRLVETTKTAE